MVTVVVLEHQIVIGSPSSWTCGSHYLYSKPLNYV